MSSPARVVGLAGYSVSELPGPLPEQPDPPEPVADTGRPLQHDASDDPGPGVDEQLDPEFYRLFNDDLFHLSEPDLIRHWESHGRFEGRSSNLVAYLAGNERAARILGSEFSVNMYKRLNRDLSLFLRTDLEYIRHYIVHGHGERRRVTVESGDLADDHDFAPHTEDLAVGGADDGTPPRDGSYHDVGDMLRRNGITSDLFVTVFDTVEYLFVHKAIGLRNELQCLRHFCERGRAELAPVALDWHFDPTFYAETVPEVAGLAPADAYLHWLNHGMQNGAKPNASMFMRELGLRDVGRLPVAFSTAVYAAANPSVARFTSRWSVLQHAIEHGIIERRPGCAVSFETLDLYLAVADHLSMAGRLAEAQSTYEQILSVDPLYSPALQHYADCLLRRGDHFNAASAYRRNIEAGRDSVWTHLNLSSSLAELGQARQSTEVLSELHRRHPGDENIRRSADASAARTFAIFSQESSWLAERGFFPEARSKMACAVDILAAHHDIGQPATVIRATTMIRSVLLVAETSLPQCRFYRVEQKIEHLRAAGIEADLIAHSDLNRIGDRLSFVDAVVFYRLPATPPVVRAIADARRAGLPTFYEIDDPVFDASHFPDTIESYGGLVSPEVYGGLVTGTVLYDRAMTLCDYGIASTPTLSESIAARVRSGQCFVHHNAFGAIHERYAGVVRARSPVGPVRIFYGTGTKAHNEDFDQLAAPALARLLRERGRTVELTIMGYLTLPACLAPFRSLIRLLDPIWDLGIYWRVLSEMDISLAVLKQGHVADCKSEIKWLEAAMVGVPSIVSSTRTYREILEDGQTGLLVDDSDAWFDALDRLVDDPQLRRRIGTDARTHAIARYSISASARNLRSIFAAVVTEPPRPKLRLMVVNVFFPPQAIGGATRVVADNIVDLQELVGSDIEIEVFTTTEGGAEPYAEHGYRWNGVRVTAVTAASVPDVDRNPSDPRMAEIFERHLRHAPPDLIHFHCIQRLTASLCGVATLLGIPYVITPHDGWWISEHQFLLDKNLDASTYRYDNPAAELSNRGPHAFHRMQELLLHMNNAARILPVSRAFADIYAACGLRNVQAVENGVSEIVPLKRMPAPDGKIRLLYAGGMEPHKGYPLVKAAFSGSSFRNLSLTVIDHSLAPGAFRSDVWGETRVRFVGKVSQSKVNQLYATHDVLLAPSVWPESYGLVAREATLCGCFVVASNRGAIGGDVTPGGGTIVDVGSAEPLQAVLREIDTDPGRYMEMIASRQPLRTSRAQAAELYRLYEEVATSHAVTADVS